jgi:hypothetical protein
VDPTEMDEGNDGHGAHYCESMLFSGLD